MSSTCVYATTVFEAPAMLVQPSIEDRVVETPVVDSLLEDSIVDQLLGRTPANDNTTDSDATRPGNSPDRNRWFGGEAIASPPPWGIGLWATYLDQPWSVGRTTLEIPDFPTYVVPNTQALSVRSWETETLAQCDWWILPCINVYGVVGYTTGGAKSDLVIPGVPGLGSPIVPLRVAYSGTTYGGGVAANWKHRLWFASIDWHYTITNLDLPQSQMQGHALSPRIGLQRPWGQVWIGTVYQDVQRRLTATIDDGLGNSILIATRLQNEEPWNFVYGFRYRWSLHKELSIEHGIGQRNQIIGSLTCRF